MSLLFRGPRRDLSSLLPLRMPSRLPTNVSQVSRDASLASSVKWACLRVRADLISTTPLDVFRQTAAGPLVDVATPPVLREPDGMSDVSEWLYSSQFDLDDVGNTFAYIAAMDRAGLPSLLEPLPVEEVSVRVQSGQVTYQVNGETIPNDRMWHERQFTTSGSPVGLSPTAYAALSMSTNLGAAEFAASWFAGHGVPAAHLRNAEKTLNTAEALEIKQKFVETTQTGDVFVTGKDWEYTALGAKASESAFMETLKATAPDICRFYGVPGDIVDVETATKSITYANVTQRNLQLLILNLGPAFTRRERAFSRLLTPRGQVVKFNTDAVLRMDPAARIEQMGSEIDKRLLTVSEGRVLLNRKPLTPEDEAEFARLFPARATQGSTANV